MGTRVEQSGEFLPCAGRAGCRHVEDLADSLHRLSPTAEDLQIIILRRNRPLLLQGDFCISLSVTLPTRRSPAASGPHCASGADYPVRRPDRTGGPARPTSFAETSDDGRLRYLRRPLRSCLTRISPTAAKSASRPRVRSSEVLRRA